MTLGEPYAGKPPVRFDEGRRCETGTDNRGQFNPAVTPRLLYWIAARHRLAIWMRFVRRAAGRITRSKDKGAGRGCRGTRATRATPAWTFKRG
jgi:hypothetical protein